jgi:hypothetical protein
VSENEPFVGTMEMPFCALLKCLFCSRSFPTPTSPRTRRKREGTTSESMELNGEGDGEVLFSGLLMAYTSLDRDEDEWFF